MFLFMMPTPIISCPAIRMIWGYRLSSSTDIHYSDVGLCCAMRRILTQDAKFNHSFLEDMTAAFVL